LHGYEYGDEEVEVDYDPYEEGEAPEENPPAHVDGDLGLDQVILEEDELAADQDGPAANEPAAVPSKKPPRSVALAPSKFTGQGKGQSCKVWCKGLKITWMSRGMIIVQLLPPPMSTFLEGAPLTQATVLAGQHVVWEWNACQKCH